MRKNNLAWTLIALGLWLWSPVLAQAPVPAWEKLNKSGKVALQAGMFAAAEQQFKLALQAAQMLPLTDSHRIDILSNLADSYKQQDMFAEAEPLYKQAVELAEKAVERQNTAGNLSSCLNNLAALYYKENKLAEAEPLMVRAISVEEKALGPTDKGLVDDLDNLAKIYKEEGKSDLVEATYKRIVSILEKSDPDSHKLAMTLDALAGFYRSCKRPADSAAPDKQALAILEKKYGQDSVQLVPCLSNLGNT